MRLSELLHMEVFDESGQHAGRVHDVRLVQDGALTSGFDQALRLHGLIIGRGALADRLGYGRSGHQGPWLVRAIVEGRNRPRFVPWHRVRQIDANRITITGSKDDLTAPEPLPRVPEGSS